MALETYLYRNTGRKRGRHFYVTPKNSPLKMLSYGRIILDKKVPRIQVNPGKQEAALICLKGEGEVRIGSQSYCLRPYDALYIPCGMTFGVSTNSFVDLAESSAPSNKKVKPIYIPFEEVKADTELHISVGESTYRREIYKLIDINVPAARLLAGITFGDAGNWTSWPPHEHTRTKEEVYLFVEMPRPSFGLQLMYDDDNELDFVERVFEDDAVAITAGYHPNVGIPGQGINFVWMMAAIRADVDRDWTDMHFQEAFVE